MSLDYTILGVLMEQPTHGYSIKKHLLETFSKKLGINDGQLYPALAKLEQRGWIIKEIVEQQRSPTKHRYRLTSAGESAFLEWLSAGGPLATDRYEYFWREELLQKCSFFRYLRPEDVVAQLRARILEVDQKMDELQKVLDRMLANHEDPYRRHVVEYGIRFQEMQRDWLQGLVLELANAEATPVSVAVEA